LACATYSNRLVSDAKAVVVFLRSKGWKVDDRAATTKTQLLDVVPEDEDGFGVAKVGMESPLQTATYREPGVK
jgi:hypothetical protein